MPGAAFELSISPDRNLARYLQSIRKFPMLEASEEYALAKRWADEGDEKAAHKLVTSHLRLVAKIAMGYRGYGLPLGELISEGNVGMMQAVMRFDPDRGFRVGLVWAGNVKNNPGRHRACPPERFDVLAQVAQVSFYSLQKDRPTELAASRRSSARRSVR